MKKDHVDNVLAQWGRERPDLDVVPMGLIGRMKRVSQHLLGEMEKTWAESGLNAASFDMLATLRRSGSPFQLTPSALMASTMVTSGTMTNRIDQLVKVGLVERVPNPEDGRGFLISLTQKGYDVIDPAVTAHVKTQHRLVEGLSAKDRAALDTLLKKYLIALENGAPS